MSDGRFPWVELSDPRFERDGLRFVTIKSRAIARRADVCVWTPPLGAAAAPLPLVILLHGVYGSAWSWALGGGAHLTVARLVDAEEIGPVALAMPSDGLWGDGSGYVPHTDADYERWIVDEVPAAAGLADDRITADSPLFIAGLSMGGFGALRLGAKYPDRFRGISAHSAVTTLGRLDEVIEERLDALPGFGQAGRHRAALAGDQRLPATAATLRLRRRQSAAARQPRAAPGAGGARHRARVRGVRGRPRLALLAAPPRRHAALLRRARDQRRDPRALTEASGL